MSQAVVDSELVAGASNAAAGDVAARRADDPDRPAPIRFPPRRGDPTWEIADLYPRQGEWTEEEYLAIGGNRRIEFTNGFLEFYAVPTWVHEWLLTFVYDRLREFVLPRKLGLTAGAGGKIRVASGRIREPDVKFLFRHRLTDPKKPSDGADVVFEIVSDDHKDRKRDLVEKRIEYAETGIPEYWIVDPETETITVLTLKEGIYEVHGEFRPGQFATSVLLAGFQVDVAACFAAGRGEAFDA